MNVMPLPHHTQLAKQMETEQSLLNDVNVHFVCMVIIRHRRFMFVAYPLMFGKCFVPFQTRTTTDKNIFVLFCPRYINPVRCDSGLISISMTSHYNTAMHTNLFLVNLGLSFRSNKSFTVSIFPH